jgi:putative tryptophan/tyrosine transport system substrate-binding protein
MRRRDFIALLGGAAAWPLAARAQQPPKLPTVGVLGSNAAIWRPWMDAFVQRLRELGWIEGRTILIEYRWADARPERVAEIAAEFVDLKVDVILTAGPNTAIAKQATSIIPIVFAISNDPVGGGLVASLAQPGGNVTGLSLQATDLSGKRVELLRELVPQLRRLAVIGNVGFRDAVLEMANVRAAARALGLEVVPLEIQRAKDITPFAALNPQADALYVVADALVTSNRTRILTLALAARLPMIFNDRDAVQAGGLMSYGTSNAKRFARAADYVNKILRGAKPGDLPVEQPTQFDLTINLTTAKALGLEVPPTLLARADEVIE